MYPRLFVVLTSAMGIATSRALCARGWASAPSSWLTVVFHVGKLFLALPPLPPALLRAHHIPARVIHSLPVSISGAMLVTTLTSPFVGLRPVAALIGAKPLPENRVRPISRPMVRAAL